MRSARSAEESWRRNARDGLPWVARASIYGHLARVLTAEADESRSGIADVISHATQHIITVWAHGACASVERSLLLGCSSSYLAQVQTIHPPGPPGPDCHEFARDATPLRGHQRAAGWPERATRTLFGSSSGRRADLPGLSHPELIQPLSTQHRLHQWCTVKEPYNAMH